jgi:hypothetical protein
METKKLIIILADISGYTRFMLDNQKAAVHGQIFISNLIESLLEQVDIPLTLQEIEGDAVFLYAAHPGADDAWHTVIEQVSLKLEKFFDAWFASMAAHIEANPCACAICRSSHLLGLKIIVHSGEAMFHTIARRPQVSGTDVILAHRLLKNSLPSNEYLLLTETAYAAMGAYLPGTFDAHRESYEGFGNLPLRVRLLGETQLAARDALYKLSSGELEIALRKGNGMVGDPFLWLRGAIQQVRNPIRPFSVREKFQMIWGAIRSPFLMHRYYPALVQAVHARGKRRERG